VLRSNRIYILPTRPGLIFGVIVFTMLLGAMNYSNNMGFALTFLLTGIGIVSIQQCHRNLASLELRALGAAPVFAGDNLQFRFTLRNPDGRARGQLSVGWDGSAPQIIELQPHAQVLIELTLPAPRRGLVNVPRLQISTRYPLGLFRAWAWINPELSGLAYPMPARGVTPTPPDDVLGIAAGPRGSGDDDFAGLRAWRSGDPPRRIAWKALARTGQMLVTEHHGGAPAPRWIDWASEPEPEHERRIARLARRVLEADAAGQAYGLRLPASIREPAQGSDHRHRCLRDLALLPTAGPAARA
jgi:uncharacterized protein (DUF58 family)